MKTNENILPIEGGERFARIYTQTVVPRSSYGHNDVAIGATLLGVAPMKIRTTEDRHEWRGNENVFVPGQYDEGLVFIFGETEETTITRFVDENNALREEVRKAQDAQKVAEKLSIEAAKERELMKETAKTMIADKNIKLAELDTVKKLRQTLETDLAKVKAFFGEKAFAEALAGAEPKKGG